MKTERVQEQKVKLDARLRQSESYVGIAFGADLYREFWKAGHIKLRQFSAVAFPSVVLHLPAYGDGRYAFSDPDIGLDEFVVGKGA